ncbi:free fatty acid receptor 4-like [Periplaneta americana]|uniref:free fatty acid receptor 4-like n=1 Tax=Periplaneta americana TaxID=6978 RepID=UPI0037E85CC1
MAGVVVTTDVASFGANSSYVFGNDTLGGWGMRYFFSFYSEFGGGRTVAAGVEVGILMLTFLISVVANASIAAAVLRYREMRTVTNCFLLNLAAADLVFALGIPAVAATRLTQEWALGDITCRILPYSQFVCGFVLLWTLTLISMDRHRCIVVPPYRSRLTPRLATVLTAVTWLIAAVLFLPVAFWFHEQPTETGTVCTLVFPVSDTVNVSVCFTAPVILLACLLPMGLLVYHYQRIFQKLLSTRSRWASPCVVVSQDGAAVGPDRRDSELSFVGSIVMPWTRKVSTASQQFVARNGSMSQHEELRLTKHLRVVRVLLLNVVVVLLMWLPITIVMFLIYVDGRRPTEDTDFFLRSHHFIWSLVVALLNTVVNPLLYGILSENFRKCFTRLWFGSRGSADVAGRTGLSKSNHDVLQECGGVSKSNGASRTPSSGRVNGYPQGFPPKSQKKSSTCSIGSILETPSGVQQV